MCFQEKTENVQIPFKVSVENLFAKIVQSDCFCYRLLKSYKILKYNEWK